MPILELNKSIKDLEDKIIDVIPFNSEYSNLELKNILFEKGFEDVDVMALLLKTNDGVLIHKILLTTLRDLYQPTTSTILDFKELFFNFNNKSIVVEIDSIRPFKALVNYNYCNP